MTVDSIIFDLDGTLWDSVDEIIFTWNGVIARNGFPRKLIDRKEQEGVMGLPMDEIGRRLFPNETAQRQMELMSQCIKDENEYLAVHGATLYPGAQETLEYLSKKYKLCIVSNCQKGYIEAFLQAHDLAEYFTDRLCFGETGLSKGENNRIVIQRNGFEKPVYVGDTAGDRQSAIDAQIPFVYAEYGFGTVNDYDMKISTFMELKALF